MTMFFTILGVGTLSWWVTKLLVALDGDRR